MGEIVLYSWDFPSLVNLLLELLLEVGFLLATSPNHISLLFWLTVLGIPPYLLALPFPGLFLSMSCLPSS